MTSPLNFEFSDASDLSEEASHVIRIPVNIATKFDLLEAFAREGRFPEYFGKNWDALLDCLRDLSWLKVEKIIIFHGDLPLHDDPDDCASYLSVLQTAVADWANGETEKTIQPPGGWPYMKHELRVIFPTSVKPAVARYI